MAVWLCLDADTLPPAGSRVAALPAARCGIGYFTISRSYARRARARRISDFHRHFALAVRALYCRAITSLWPAGRAVFGEYIAR